MAAFKVDENLPSEAAELLRSAGYDALTVLEQRLGGESDASLSNICVAEERAIVTLDLDFSDIRTYPPADFFGILVLRLVRQDKQTILAVLGRLLPLLEQEPIAGKLWIVDESRVRIRE